ncbi:hypothetical protein ATANTOWER_022087 [Ataeniobius toweri]|uniref:Uncharacterized protein n=1 Tax=Ataeniobius toweri TaxID=208326 RepID=A0ABU7BUE7_9TELE|nr:hypothetical protein [Ataeniobius toweri]
MMVALSCCEDAFLQLRAGRLGELMGRWMELSILDKNVFAKDLRLGRRFTSQQDKNRKHTDPPCHGVVTAPLCSILPLKPNPEVHPHMPLWVNLHLSTGVTPKVLEDKLISYADSVNGCVVVLYVALQRTGDLSRVHPTSRS